MAQNLIDENLPENSFYVAEHGNQIKVLTHSTTPLFVIPVEVH